MICATLPPDKRVNYSKLDPHHIIPRKHKATRWDIRNRLWVCSTHHTMGTASNTVQYNLGGWFLNWDSDTDWMGINLPEDKEHLRELYKTTRHWELSELENLIANFGL